MKRLSFILLTLCVSLFALAQGERISHSKYDTDSFRDMGGKRGVLLLSKMSDLVVSVTNTKSEYVTIKPTGVRTDGLYSYEVIVEANIEEVAVEVRQRGDVFMDKFVVMPKKNLLMTYLIEKVERPIQESVSEDGTILNGDSAVVDFTSTIEDLQIDCKKITSIGGKLVTQNLMKEKGVIVRSLFFPVKVKEKMQSERDKLEKEIADLNAKLLDENIPLDQKPQSEWDRLELLEAQKNDKEKLLDELKYVDVYARGTNKLRVDISDLVARKRKTYGILLLSTQKVFVNECSGFLDEAVQQFEKREYLNARQAFECALNAKDTPQNMKESIRNCMAQCDSCMLYERLTLGALGQMSRMRRENTGTQEEVRRYGGAALEFLEELSKYNQCEFYSSRIRKLEDLLDNMPLQIKFTIVKWVNDYSGFREGGKMSNVETWAYYGTSTPTASSYLTDRNFAKQTNSSNYQMMGTSDETGEVELHLDRKKMPVGIFFRPVGYGGKAKIKYMAYEEVLRKSEGTYDKRQVRLKMYIAK